MTDGKFTDAANDARSALKRLAKSVLDMKIEHSTREATKSEDRGEVMANLMLTYRHLEDASMRLGKAIQAYDGGVSVYDKKTTVGA